jgi:type III secretion protein SpaR/YscT/HrcT
VGADRLALLIVTTTLGAARLAPVVWLMPPLGGPRFPAPARLGFAVLLALVASPLLTAGEAGVRFGHVSSPVLALMLGREVIIGSCLGLIGAAVFRAAEIAGRLADTLRGANIGEVFVPTAEERSSPLGALYLLLATLVFLHIGGVERITEALLSSYRALPVGGGFGTGAARRAAMLVGEASARLIAAGVALAAPVVVAIWLADVALGLIARAAPQVPVYFVGLPMKGLLAIGVVLLGLGGLAGAISGETGFALTLFRRTIATFAG